MKINICVDGEYRGIIQALHSFHLVIRRADRGSPHTDYSDDTEQTWLFSQLLPVIHD
jgi:hypothetical protein